MKEESQKCFKCEEIKPLSEFYVHPQMSNGHLGICKKCVKDRQRVRSKTQNGKDSEKKRNKKPERAKKIAERSKKWREDNPEKALAHSRLWHAIQDGKIVRKTKCEECGSTEKIHAHHEDYSKALDVIWLCVPCHGKRHPNYIAD